MIYALSLLLAGIVLKAGYDVTQHTSNDHLQHHAGLVVINELMRRDPSLRDVLNAVMGTVPETPVEMITPPLQETIEPTVEDPPAAEPGQP